MNELLKIAFSQYGVREIYGVENNAIILNYFKDIGKDFIKDDETAWCSAFINWCALKAGLERSGELTARSWLNIGEKIKNPVLGDVVIFWRESKNSWKGHVGLFINEDERYIWTLGGNQGNMVKITPYDKERVLGYRRLNKIK